jgi:hypothetical protein
MYIPAQFLPNKVARSKPARLNAVRFERAESNPDSAKQMLDAHVIVFEKREGEDRRKRKMKTILDTRSGRDRRHDKAKAGISVKA